LIGNGDGTFRAPASYSSGTTVGLAVADVNGDGRLDAVAVRNVSTFSGRLGNFTPLLVLLGDGHGGLSLSQSFSVGGTAGGPYTGQGSIALSDLNGDQIPEVVTANYRGLSPFFTGGGSVSVLPNIAFGFIPSSTRFFASGMGLVGLAIADVNGDGKPDVVAVSPTAAFSPGQPPGHLAVFLGKGDGTFQPPRSFDIGGDARSLALVDLDGDGDLDAVVAAGPFSSSGGVAVLLNNGPFGN